jgi:hypothetical protein
METIKILGTDDTPNVILDANNEIFEISGRSLPEDVSAFYEPILAWLDEYAQNPNPKTMFTFKLVYFNTASSKLLLDILMRCEHMKEDGADVVIRWCYPDDDEDMQEAGEEYADIVDVPFEMEAYSL